MHTTVMLQRTGGRDPPYDHNFRIGSAVYAMLKETSGEAADVFHDAPGRSAYVLSEIHRVKKKPGEAWFRIGTSSEAVSKAVGRALIPGTEIRVGEASFQVTGLMLEEPVARPGEYVTLSPILLRDRNTGRSVVHDSEGYVNILEAAINRQVENHLGEEGRVKVVHFEAQAVRKRTIKDRTVLAQKGRMLLDGEEEQLKLLVNHGIGLSPALGFGMVVPGLPMEQIMMIGFDKVRRRGGV